MVKAAGACSESGWKVAVVSVRKLSAVEPLDDDVLSRSNWTSHRIDLRSKWHWRRYRLREETERALGFIGRGRRHATPAATMALRQRVLKIPARLYIAHYVAALPVAAAAAARHGGQFAFDAEDFHLGEFSPDRFGSTARRDVREIEAAHLPHAAFVTAAAPLIATAYATEYGIDRPTVVLNVFTNPSAPQGPTTSGIAPCRPSIYWFSQTIGPDRGLECAVKAVARSKWKPHLYLRGTVANGYDTVLLDLAAGLGIAEHIHLLPPALPSQMENLAAEHDIGLISETGHTLNRRIALTNKQFTYLSAGVPLVMSNTPAHIEFAREAGSVVSLFEVNDPDSLAAVIDARLGDAQSLARSRREAFELGQRRYNWELEKRVLVSRVRRTIGRAHD